MNLQLNITSDVFGVLSKHFERLIQTRRTYVKGEVLSVSVQFIFKVSAELDALCDARAFIIIQKNRNHVAFPNTHVHDKSSTPFEVRLS
jgi:hypothetical protein